MSKTIQAKRDYSKGIGETCKRFILWFAFITIPLIGQAQLQHRDSIVYVPYEEAYKRQYDATKIEGIKPELDGMLDEAFWNNHGVWSEPFVQVKPYQSAVSEHNTRMKLLFDDKFIYVGVICYDTNPQEINRFIGNRDEYELGDMISVAFDTYHDYRAATQFIINAGGNKSDMTITDGMDENLSWNAVWDGKTHINAEEGFWTAELRIPFSQLRYRHNSDLDVWGLHVQRIIYRNDEELNWSMIPQNRNGYVYSFGELHGMSNLPKTHNFEISPYMMGSYQREPAIEGSPYQKGNNWGGDIGLDAKLTVSDYTLDLTINPDYGQVEQDPSVMNLTTQETFYDEKRPFFLEGNHIFDFSHDQSNNMFYTRRIGSMPSHSPDVDNETSFTETEKHVPIIGALKLTGTNESGFTVGIVQSVTARASSKVTRNGEESKEVVEPLTNFTVARLQKNWNGNTLLGGMLTSTNRHLDVDYLKEELVRNAFTGGIDFTHYFKDRLYYVEGKAMFSSLNGSAEAITKKQRSSVHYYQRTSAQDYLGVDPTRTSLSGTGGSFEIGRRGNSKWMIFESFSWSSPGFDLNDVGYLRQTDKLSNTSFIKFQQRSPWKIFRSIDIDFSQSNEWNYGKKLLENTFEAEIEAMMLNRMEWGISGGLTINKRDTRMLRGGPDMLLKPSVSTSAEFSTDKAQRLFVEVDYRGEHSINKDLTENSIEAEFSYRIGNHALLSGEFTYEWNRNDLQYVSTLRNGQYENNPLYVMGRMKQKTYGLTLRAQLNITPDFSIQFYGAPFTSIGKYDDFKAAADTESKVYENRFRRINAEEENLRNPNFSFNEFRTNLVARWEYRPGSTLYLVWEHSASNEDERYISGWGNNLDRMMNIPSVNTFMVKINYRFGADSF